MVEVSEVFQQPKFQSLYSAMIYCFIVDFFFFVTNSDIDYL